MKLPFSIRIFSEEIKSGFAKKIKISALAYILYQISMSEKEEKIWNSHIFLDVMAQFQM